MHLEDDVTYDLIETELNSIERDHLSALPSQPENPMILIHREPDRSTDLWNGQTHENVQPSIDLKAGMTTTVQLNHVEKNVVRFTALSHNTIRGAAGGVVLLAELAHHRNFLSSVDLNPTPPSSES